MWRVTEALNSSHETFGAAGASPEAPGARQPIRASEQASAEARDEVAAMLRAGAIRRPSESWVSVT
jgi:hypothetical protein